MNKRNILCKPENLFPTRGRMPIFCPGYAQIGTPFGRKENTMERRFWTQQSSVNNTIQAAGKNICKRVWKMHPPRNADQKSGFPDTKPPLCEPQAHSRFPGSSHRAAYLGWSGIFAKSLAKDGLFLWGSHFWPLQPAWFLGIIGVELQSTPRQGTEMNK